MKFNYKFKIPDLVTCLIIYYIIKFNIIAKLLKNEYYFLLILYSKFLTIMNITMNI